MGHDRWRVPHLVDYVIIRLFPNIFNVVKFGDTREKPEAVYLVDLNKKGWRQCSCPSRKRPCKHVGLIRERTSAIIDLS